MGERYVMETRSIFNMLIVTMTSEWSLKRNLSVFYSQLWPGKFPDD